MEIFLVSEAKFLKLLGILASKLNFRKQKLDSLSSAIAVNFCEDSNEEKLSEFLQKALLNRTSAAFEEAT